MANPCMCAPHRPLASVSNSKHCIIDYIFDYFQTFGKYGSESEIEAHLLFIILLICKTRLEEKGCLIKMKLAAKWKLTKTLFQSHRYNYVKNHEIEKKAPAMCLWSLSSSPLPHVQSNFAAHVTCRVLVISFTEYSGMCQNYCKSVLKFGLKTNWPS